MRKLITALLILTLSLAIFVGCTPAQSNYDRVFNLIKEKKYDDAKKEALNMNYNDKFSNELKEYFELRDSVVKNLNEGASGIGYYDIVLKELENNSDNEIKGIYTQLRSETGSVVKSIVISNLEKKQYDNAMLLSLDYRKRDNEMEVLYYYSMAMSMLTEKNEVGTSQHVINKIPSNYKGIYADNIIKDRTRILNMKAANTVITTIDNPLANVLYFEKDKLVIPKTPSDDVLDKIHTGMNLNEVLELRDDCVEISGENGKADNYYFSNGDSYWFDTSTNPPKLGNMSGNNFHKNGDKVVVPYGTRNGKRVKLN